MIALLLAVSAPAQQISLGVGRIGVLTPGFAPTELSTSAARVIDVVPSPPAILVLGLEPGSATLTIASEGAGGPLRYEVIVAASGDVAPSGGPGLAPSGERLALPPGLGAVCTIPSASRFTRIEDPYATVRAFGDDYFVEVHHPGRGDVAFERSGALPRVITVASAADLPGPPPEGCALATTSVRVPPGGSVDLDVPGPIAGFVVGSSAVLHAAPIEGTDRIRLSGMSPGTTTIAVRSARGGEPWLRRVVVAAGP